MWYIDLMVSMDYLTRRKTVGDKEMQKLSELEQDLIDLRKGSDARIATIMELMAQMKKMSAQQIIIESIPACDSAV